MIRPIDVVRYRVGTLIVGDGSLPLENVVVSVDRGRFSDVRSVEVGELEDGTVDFRRYTMIPGLIDAHVHLGHDGLPHGSSNVFAPDALPASIGLRALAHAQAHLRSGFTTIRVLGTSDHVDVAVRDAIDKGLFQGPRVFAAGQAIGSTGGHMDQTARPGDSRPAWVFDSPAEAVRAARHQLKMGVDCIKVAIDGLQWTPRQGGRVPRGPYLEMSSAELQAIVEVAHTAGVHVAAHTDGAGVRAAVEAGVRTIEHLKSISKEDAQLMARSGTFLTATMTATANTISAGSSASGLSEQGWAFFERQWEAKRAAFGLALREGVRLVVGTDAGYSLCPHGGSAREIELFVECGMPPLDAISAATGVAADAIQQAHELGTVASGKVADFIVVDGDPLTDISVLGRRDRFIAVYKAGERVYDDAR